MTDLANTRERRRAGWQATAIALAVLPALGSAQEVDHSRMHHPPPQQTAPAEPVPAKPATEPDTTPAPADPSADTPESQAGHSSGSHDVPPANAEPDHAAMGHGAPVTPDRAVHPVDHTKMDHSAMDHAAMGHDEPQAQSAAPSPPPVDHTTMEHPATDHSAMGHADGAPTEPHTPIPVLTDADRAAAMPPPNDHPVHDNGIFSYVLFNRLESWNAGPDNGMKWEAQGWIGTDIDRVWLRTEGERNDGRTESADVEVLYGRSVSPWWDVVAGIRHDFKPEAPQDFLALGVIGLAPYMFEVEATGYVGTSGRSEARIEVEYEMLLTNRLILQPLVEVNLFGHNDQRRGIGSGLGTVEAGLRLRYEFSRRFAPYIGVVRERAHGRTADLRREAGREVDDTRVVAGLRIWF